MSEFLQHLAFDPSRPLNFASLFFWGYFAVVLVGFSLIHKRLAWRNAYLFLVSIYFYYKTSYFFFFLLLFSTGVDYTLARWMENTARQPLRVALVTASVVVNLFVLFYFKYVYFFADAIKDLAGIDWRPIPHYALWSNAHFGTDFPIDRIALPVGISFYTFQCISYTVDVYRRQIQAVKNPLDFGFYISFFPQLVAGPIVRASDFIPQLYQPYNVDRKSFGLGLFWVLNGLLKKVFLADYLAVNFIDRVFAQPTLYSGVETMLALFGYSLQVYADFSGYTDVAIGLALWMGFSLTKNFNSPYKAANVGEFWQRWHISLSGWLKDYVYIPLGGNRTGSWVSYLLAFLALFGVAVAVDAYWVSGALAVMVGLFYLGYRRSPSLR
jgi:D-alanyl-lipoteichoic acid acyltransferase DltB (MBOAT superfamily)